MKYLSKTIIPPTRNVKYRTSSGKEKHEILFLMSCCVVAAGGDNPLFNDMPVCHDMAVAAAVIVP